MVDGDTFRRVMGNFATGVTVVTQPADPPHGMTANAVASVSLDPPLVLVCVDHDTECYELFEEGGIDSYAVTVLAADQLHLGEHFASMRDLEAPFETEPTLTAETGAPIFEEGLAYLDCTVDARHPAGDHTIYVGRALEADVLDPDGDALTFFRGEWGTIEADA